MAEAFGFVYILTWNRTDNPLWTCWFVAAFAVQVVGVWMLTGARNRRDTNAWRLLARWSAVTSVVGCLLVYGLQLWQLPDPTGDALRYAVRLAGVSAVAFSALWAWQAISAAVGKLHHARLLALIAGAGGLVASILEVRMTSTGLRAWAGAAATLATFVAMNALWLTLVRASWRDRRTIP
jgi:hypothetical protein